MSNIKDFITKVQSVFNTGDATEHSYRSAVEYLISSTAETITAINEPRRVACGAPDFIVYRKDIVVGHIEAKDLVINLTSLNDSNKEQKGRYLGALPNLIYTNCLDWEFYRNGEQVAAVSIAVLKNNTILPLTDSYNELERLLEDFVVQKAQTITSPSVLAKMMAGKAGLIKNVLRSALGQDEGLKTEIEQQYQAFKRHLIHDIKHEDFADIYAETIAYGMFAARLHDTSLDTFSRQEALDLLPKSNPFLRSLFGYIAGQDLDDRIRWIIDDLADVFRAANVAKILEGFGRMTSRKDPFLHFYETFLAAYNPSKRKARGVWYTPEPVVNFIVKAVDEVLVSEFGLVDGLADTSKVTIDWDVGQTNKQGKRVTIKKDVHRVQVLDPATGTGTFLAEVIKQIAPKIKDVAEGMWSSYIEQDLIPRMHGFELLMASYAMCHMKLDMILTELGYKPTGAPPRLSVYLTNSLEEGEPANQTLPFAQWLSNEVKQANTIKRDMPIMCIVGNPPYSGISQNMGAWIKGLIEDYKYVDGVHFKERKHWLQDDYVKFIRLSENLIESNGEGVLGFITNHGYLDNATFRGMRWHLLQTFDKIYVVDLHGNANKKEVGPGGLADKNVFDIRQGVSIMIAVKRSTDEKAKEKKPRARVFHKEIWGARASKYEALEGMTTLGEFGFTELTPDAPSYLFRSIDDTERVRYESFFSLADLFKVKGLGFQSSRDNLVVGYTKAELISNIEYFVSDKNTDDAVRDKFFGGKKDGKYTRGDTRQWDLPNARKVLQKSDDWRNDILNTLYRPFDIRPVLYRSDMVDWPRPETLNNMKRENLSLIMNRQSKEEFGILCSNIITERKLAAAYDGSTTAPLYVYPVKDGIAGERIVNFDEEIFKKLKALGNDAERGEPNEVDVFEYIYGVLYSPDYREDFAEFLSLDFPRVPWPDSPAEFWMFADTGKELKNLHLMLDSAIGKPSFPLTGVDGGGLVEAGRFKDHKIWINEMQYFEGVPQEAWETYFGGYQPLQKWLKDRKNRKLSFDDVKTYQKIIQIVVETNRIMNEMKKAGSTEAEGEDLAP
ncbi:MAG: N-6 DNA methylase [Gammaproteobacteria bacterium]|nr:N-6 DNA methylase [Gammaproteobacteria bacterium]MBU1600630.1 N-6 DNA methylase [Gammaproteobacteria bacterium]MBU2435086.1 N-6 DNA methylase [Gammaproteobacteria bacterium]MBU2448322.1 N-6 DNA methylase [Gammaproteobacteria bacterium]